MKYLLEFGVKIVDNKYVCVFYNKLFDEREK